MSEIGGFFALLDKNKELRSYIKELMEKYPKRINDLNLSKDTCAFDALPEELKNKEVCSLFNYMRTWSADYDNEQDPSDQIAGSAMQLQMAHYFYYILASLYNVEFHLSINLNSSQNSDSNFKTIKIGARSNSSLNLRSYGIYFVPGHYSKDTEIREPLFIFDGYLEYSLEDEIIFNSWIPHFIDFGFDSFSLRSGILKYLEKNIERKEHILRDDLNQYVLEYINDILDVF